MSQAPRVDIGLNAVIVAVTDDRPRVLTVLRSTCSDTSPVSPPHPGSRGSGRVDLAGDG